jgi:hypothetical protein
LSKKKSTKKVTEINIMEAINDWSDEEVLINLAPFFDRVSIGVDFMEDDEGLLTHQVLCVVCGDKVIASQMKELDWPLQRLPVPEAFKGSVH